jgi:glycosyltransferase involved in cell wall biosynthesis
VWVRSLPNNKMKLAVFSYKLCWPSASSPSGYATDGGFPFQMHALSELFDVTALVVPCSSTTKRAGGMSLTGHNLSITSLTNPTGSGFWRKVGFLFWLLRNSPVLIREIHRADVVHAPIPGDIGTIGMLLALIWRKPLFVRYCGNWFLQRTAAEHFWSWFMQQFAGGKNVMLATGGAAEPPSPRNPNVRWIFSTSLPEHELRACSRRRAQPEAQRARLIIVCRQEKGKGIETVIESLPLVLQAFPNATLDVVGDGGELLNFKQLAVAQGVESKITFHGKVDHAKVISLLQQADLFCYPTASEGFPKAVLEALACGLPVVTTRVSVLPELIGTGCGLLIDEATPEAVAEAVFDCLSNTERYRVLSAQAVETASQYSLERWRDTIGGFLQAACGPLKSDA